MQFHRYDADILAPQGMTADAALARTTHLGIGAHQDDLEIMAFHGILAAYDRDDAWFSGVTVTDGAGVPRTGRFAQYSDAEIVHIRREEQRNAAALGRYAAQVQLGYTSAEVKDAGNLKPLEDLVALLAAAQPHTLYTHNLADRHDTHVAVALRVIDALRALPEDQRPEKVYGCEVWRSLDWLPDDAKVALEVSGGGDLQERLIAEFEAPLAGGKRYDLAAPGRQRANATYHHSHEVDAATGISFAIDMTPLMRDATLDPLVETRKLVERFLGDVVTRIEGLR